LIRFAYIANSSGNNFASFRSARVEPTRDLLAPIYGWFTEIAVGLKNAKQRGSLTAEGD
jgi:hypothetical protein